MSDRRKLPDSVFDRIRKLASRGWSQKAITKTIGCSHHTVKKALDPGYAERERVRQRKADAKRAPKRGADPARKRYLAEYGKTPEHLARVRARMRWLRAERKQAKPASDS